MRQLSVILVMLLGLTVNGLGLAGEVRIVEVNVDCNSNCTFRVTLEHDDEGWDHYADQWDVVTMDGELLKSRVLMHPHEHEQPFTRSLSGVKIPEGTKAIKIRARDSKHGYSPKEFILQLP